MVSKNRYHVHYCARGAEIDHAQIQISGTIVRMLEQVGKGHRTHCTKLWCKKVKCKMSKMNVEQKL